VNRPLLVLRPEPGASATAQRARDAGLFPVVMPLFVVEPIAPPPLDNIHPDAVLISSANAVRHASTLLRELQHQPLFAIGETTAQAARAIGLQPHIGGGTLAKTLPMIQAAGHNHVLHVCGEDVVPVSHGALKLERAIVYRASAISSEPLGFALATLLPAVCLLHSPRAAARLAELIAEPDRSVHQLVCISAAVAAASGSGWGKVLVAQRPDDRAMLALAHDLCQCSSIDGNSDDKGLAKP
jgi:uroporphyrinogen-III synthase